MGLQQDYTDSSENIGNYWKIINYANDIVNSVLTLTVAVYKNKAAKDNGAGTMDEFPLRLVGDDYSDIMSPDALNGAGKNPRANLYPWLKSNMQAHYEDIDLSSATKIDPD